ncbi:ATP-binding response regulator [Ramlibacter sp.]|uniref:ATP-binding response regulator n=1 Tax=Ramlibacter sp. TaxID=1917967 RepID=UPI003D0B8DF9
MDNHEGATPPLAVNILIVDDEPKNLAVLETVLDDPGYRLVRATSGEEALLALMADEFAVLVLDVRMPGMSGFELAAMVKERKKTSRIPIIFLTAYYNEDQHILEGYGTGAVDYLHKPVNPSVLRSKVGVFAELHRKGRMLEAANRMLLAEVGERRHAEQKLNELNQTLDRRVTERTAELEASEARLMAASARKDEFLATLAHELRNPLAPVRNAVEILKRRGHELDRVQWATALVDRQVNAFTRLIDDLMDVSRINQGRVELKREVVTLNDVLSDAIETVRPHVDAARHDFTVLLPDRQIAVDGDRTRLAQAFVNLLHNATKYTDAGGRIEVAVLVENRHAVVTIRDTGIGIPHDSLEKVFDMFSQVESALSRSRGGLGIGLALTQRLVQMHGGTIKAYSDGPGRGSRFMVSLPIAAEEVPAAPAAKEEAMAGVQAGFRILVADDNVDAADTLAALLDLLGHTAHVVHDGEAAALAVPEFDPEIVILDIGMPKLNGYEACRRIRAQDGGAGRVLVALTGWGQEQDLARSREAGFDRHLVKPIAVDALQSLLEEVAAQPRAASAPKPGLQGSL